MASIPRLTPRSSAEEVECLDELITNILSRLSTRDVLKMSTVRKRWRALIFDPGFVHTHYKNCHKESIFCLTHIVVRPTLEQYQFRSYNSQTGNLSIVPFSREGLDSSFQNGWFEISTATNGLIFFYPEIPWYVPVLWVYNPMTKFLKKMSLPFVLDIDYLYFAELCYTQNTLKFVVAGLSVGEEHPYTLVFDSHLNSWYSGQPLHLSGFINRCENYPLATQVFLNGVIYFVVRVTSRDAQELEGFRDLESLYEDGDDLLNMIVGYDVNQDQWGFSVFVPASVGFIFRLIEWEGNLLVCASNSTSHPNDRRINYCCEGDGHFVFWILDTEHKRWIQEHELDLSHELHTSWKVSASGGVVWFTCGYNSVIVYHMKGRHWSRHRLDDVFALRQPRVI